MPGNRVGERLFPYSIAQVYTVNKKREEMVLDDEREVKSNQGRSAETD